MLSYFEVDAVQELLHRGGFGLLGPPPPASLFRLRLLLDQHVHVDELESADFAVEHPHPGPHGRLADDVEDVSALQNTHKWRDCPSVWDPRRQTSMLEPQDGCRSDTFSLRESVSYGLGVKSVCTRARPQKGPW